jgi:DNA-binding XRE family transcriptional regulator
MSEKANNSEAASDELDVAAGTVAGVVEERFVDLVRVARQRLLTGAIVRDGLAPNRMAVSRWARGEVGQRTQTQVVSLAKWLDEQTGLRLSHSLGLDDAAWRAAVEHSASTLTSLRRSLGLRQADVAAGLGVSRPTYLACEHADARGESVQLAVQAREWIAARSA